MVKYTKHDYGINPWLIWASGALFYGYQFIVRVAPNVISDELMQTFGLDATGLGFLTGIYYYGYAGMQIPLGLIMDRFGPRIVLGIASILCGVATWIFAESGNVYLAGSARFLIGAASAGGFLGCIKLSTLWFSSRQMAMALGLTMFVGTTGASLGGAPLEFLVNVIGWRMTFQIVAGLGLIVGAIILIYVKNGPNHDPAKGEGVKHAFKSLLTVARSPQAWLAGIFGMLLYVPIAVVGDQWGVSFVEQTYGIHESIAATVVLAMFIGVALGGPIMARVSDITHTRKTPMLIGAICTSVCYTIILALPTTAPLWLLYILFFLCGLFFNGQPMCFAVNTESRPRSISGAALGFTNMVVMLSGVFALPLVGWLLDYHGDTPLINGHLSYTANDFNFAFLMIPICLFAAIMLVFFIKETYPKPQEKQKK
jgi:sugar phosphate permease